MKGYKIRLGTQRGNYTESLSVGKRTTAIVTDLERGMTYYIVVVAVDAQGNESPPSNEVEVVVRD